MSASRRADLERIQQAAIWMARLWSDEPTQQQRVACEAWRNADPDNEKAWQCTLNAQTRLAMAPKNSTHLITRSRTMSRRNMLGLAGFGAGGLMFAGGYQLHDNKPHWAGYLTSAQLSTQTGEIKKLRMHNGAQLAVNTATDISMSAADSLVLNDGEIWLESRSETPVYIDTPNGRITHRGGQFSVRHTNAHSKVSLFSGNAAKIKGSNMADAMLLHPLHKIDFRASEVGPLHSANINDIGWVKGKLVVQNMPLADFIAELSRYRTGMLRISPELADLSVTGVFTLSNTDLILQQLRASLPIKVQQLTRYWVSISAV